MGPQTNLWTLKARKVGMGLNYFAFCLIFSGLKFCSKTKGINCFYSVSSTLKLQAWLTQIVSKDNIYNNNTANTMKLQVL